MSTLPSMPSLVAERDEDSMTARELIDQTPMSRFQWTAVGICVVLNMLDGFDVLVMAFTAASVSAEWGLTGTQLGVLLSAGLFGMGAGSLLLSPWADRFGRRPLIIFSLVLIAAGMLCSAFARGMAELATWRVLTGVGIGGILASMSVITSEYSSARWRSTAISIMTTGYTVGATIGGAIAAWLLPGYGWHSVFLFGGLLSVLLVPIVIWWLPESVDFLLAKRPKNALVRLNRLMRAMGHRELSELPESSAMAAQSTVQALLQPQVVRSTVLIWSAFFLLMSSFYFVMSWTPRLLVGTGLSAAQGIAGGVLLNLGGIFGGLLFGFAAARFGLKRLTAVYLIVSAASVALFGVFVTQHALAMFLAVIIGGFATGAMAGLYSLTPLLYEPIARVTGMGWAIGVGRIGAIVAPLLAGTLLDAGWQGASLFFVFSVPFLAALAAVQLIKAPGRDPASG